MANLTEDQKQYIRDNLKFFSVGTMATRLRVYQYLIHQLIMNEKLRQGIRRKSEHRKKIEPEPVKDGMFDYSIKKNWLL